MKLLIYTNTHNPYLLFEFILPDDAKYKKKKKNSWGSLARVQGASMLLTRHRQHILPLVYLSLRYVDGPF